MWLMTLLLGCGDVESAQRPVPGSLTLTPQAATEGRPMSIAIEGAAPGETVYLGVTTRGLATSPLCPSGFDDCVEIDRPILLGTEVADAQGDARFTVTPPRGSNGADVWFQALTPTGSSLPEAHHIGGFGTFYPYPWGGDACSLTHTPHAEDWPYKVAFGGGTGIPCGAFVEIDASNAVDPSGAPCPGGVILAEVADACPECEANHLDMAEATWDALGLDRNCGTVDDLVWQAVERPTTSDIGVVAVSGSSMWWFGLHFLNTRYPIRTVEAFLPGQNWVTLDQQAANDFATPITVAWQLPVQLRVTSTHGQEATGVLLGWGSGISYDFGDQFPTGFGGGF